VRSYRLPDGTVLVEMGHASALHLALDEHGRFTHDGGIIEPRTFEHRSASGTVLASYGQPKTYALDDYFYILELYFVADGAFVRGNLEIGGPSGVYRCTLTTERVLALA
jgi:hypothetical protein